MPYFACFYMYDFRMCLVCGNKNGSESRNESISEYYVEERNLNPYKTVLVFMILIFDSHYHF